MAEYTEQDVARASEIVDNLLQGERPFERLSEGLSIFDVEADANEFLHDTELLASIGVGHPAMEVAGGPPTPVSLSTFFLLPVQFRGPLGRPSVFREFLRDELYYKFRDRERRLGDFVILSPEEARANFLNRARTFLANRIAALRQSAGIGSRPGRPANTLNLRQYAGGPPTQVAGCRFSVSTNSPGLTAYWSGAYFISSNYLGAPTTPVVGILQAGTYVFGINGGAYGNVVQWDTNAVCTLPGNPGVHLQY